ncbi:hypothetical protein HYH03_013041 [Edaphochlamys debaryana]|uniref:Uncharacterized protein n=1 Tax=Edaphochlamys debaryana TaxID=47281 RepID=A0A836BTA8_9CHLO|nr:hypothetical protein HYH03_013041 [Edaphochlamys debaryana]|eukprot:KAG2488351.1 hypothetical protein HYH03_013041 [Edaphochlamys debaryana]
MIEIDLTKNQLAGAIPPQWGLMRGLIEMELDDNPGLTGCLPDGTPPQERWCSSWAATKCVAFTTDRLLGTATGGTQLRGRCAPYPGGDAALAAGLRCPTIEDYRQPLTRFFARRERGGVQALPQGGVGARPATLPAKPALEAAAAAAPAAAFTPVENRMPTLFANLG